MHVSNLNLHGAAKARRATLPVTGITSSNKAGVGSIYSASQTTVQFLGGPVNGILLDLLDENFLEPLMYILWKDLLHIHLTSRIVLISYLVNRYSSDIVDRALESILNIPVISRIQSNPEEQLLVPDLFHSN